MSIFGPPLAGRCLGPYLNLGPVLAPTHVQKWRWPRGKDRPGLSPRYAQRLHLYRFDRSVRPGHHRRDLAKTDMTPTHAGHHVTTGWSTKLPRARGLSHSAVSVASFLSQGPRLLLKAHPSQSPYLAASCRPETTALSVNDTSWQLGVRSASRRVTL